MVTILIFSLLHLAKTGDSDGQSIQNKCMQNGIAIVQALFGSSFDENALHGQRPSRSISIIVAILSLMGFTLFVCYTSTFTSSLATKELKIPFQSLKELSQHASFRLRSFCYGTTITRLNKTISEDSELTNQLILLAKKNGFTDKKIAKIKNISEKEIRQYRHTNNIRPIFRLVDTCAGEFSSKTPSKI